MTVVSFIIFRSANVDISIGTIVERVLIYLGLPFLLGILSRVILVKYKGEVWFEKLFISATSPLALIALLFTTIVMFSLKGKLIIRDSDGRGDHPGSFSPLFHIHIYHQFLHYKSIRSYL